ncbi:MAG: methyltransferase domain-containing protein, partial [Candidatus Omnitrophica bacterium]|nr:methyltransferase domain-containing protein [Candidatus Omnitrophota bacterium]
MKKIIKKAIAAILAVAFLFNDVAVAGDLYSLATPKGVTLQVVKERFDAAYNLVSGTKIREMVDRHGGFANLNTRPDFVRRAGKRVDITIAALPGMESEMDVRCKFFAGLSFPGVDSTGPVIFVDPDYFSEEEILGPEKAKIRSAPSRKPKDILPDLMVTPNIPVKSTLKITQDIDNVEIKKRFPTARFITPPPADTAKADEEPEKNDYIYPENVTRNFRDMDDYFRGDISKAIRSAIVNADGSNTRPRVLIIGPGAGIIIYELKKMFPEIDLVFINKQEIQLKYETYKKILGHECRDEEELRGFIDYFRKNVMTRDVETGLPFDKGAFDIVIMAPTVLQYIKEKAAVLSEIKRVLKKNGKAFIDSMNQFDIYLLAYEPLGLDKFFDRINGKDPNPEYECRDCIGPHAKERYKELVITNTHPDKPFPALRRKSYLEIKGSAGFPATYQVMYIYDLALIRFIRRLWSGIFSVRLKRVSKTDVTVTGSAANPVTARIKAGIVYQVNKMAAELGRPVTETPFKEILEHAERALSKIAEKMNKKRTDPDITIRTSSDKPVVEPSERELKIGIFGSAADPLHWGHLLIALDAMAEYELDKVVFVIQGKDPLRKPYLENTQEVRHEVAKETLALFEPLFEYSSVSKGAENDTEKSTFEILKLNSRQKIKAHFLVGADHYRARDLKGNPDVLPKLERNMIDPSLGFDSRVHKLAVIFFERGPRGPPVPLTIIDPGDVKFLPPLPFEASSTMIRGGDFTLMPYVAYRLIRDDPDGILRERYGIKPRSGGGPALGGGTLGFFSRAVHGGPKSILGMFYPGLGTFILDPKRGPDTPGDKDAANGGQAIRDIPWGDNLRPAFAIKPEELVVYYKRSGQTLRENDRNSIWNFLPPELKKAKVLAGVADESEGVVLLSLSPALDSMAKSLDPANLKVTYQVLSSQILSNSQCRDLVEKGIYLYHFDPQTRRRRPHLFKAESVEVSEAGDGRQWLKMSIAKDHEPFLGLLLQRIGITAERTIGTDIGKLDLERLEPGEYRRAGWVDLIEALRLSGVQDRFLGGLDEKQRDAVEEETDDQKLVDRLLADNAFMQNVFRNIFALSRLRVSDISSRDVRHIGEGWFKKVYAVNLRIKNYPDPFCFVVKVVKPDVVESDSEYLYNERFAVKQVDIARSAREKILHLYPPVADVHMARDSRSRSRIVFAEGLVPQTNASLARREMDRYAIRTYLLFNRVFNGRVFLDDPKRPNVVIHKRPRARYDGTVIDLDNLAEYDSPHPYLVVLNLARFGFKVEDIVEEAEEVMGTEAALDFLDDIRSVGQTSNIRGFDETYRAFRSRSARSQKEGIEIPDSIQIRLNGLTVSIPAGATVFDLLSERCTNLQNYKVSLNKMNVEGEEPSVSYQDRVRAYQQCALRQGDRLVFYPKTIEERGLSDTATDRVRSVPDVAVVQYLKDRGFEERLASYRRNLHILRRSVNSVLEKDRPLFKAWNRAFHRTVRRIVQYLTSYSVEPVKEPDFEILRRHFDRVVYGSSKDHQEWVARMQELYLEAVMLRREYESAVNAVEASARKNIPPGGSAAARGVPLLCLGMIWPQILAPWITVAWRWVVSPEARRGGASADIPAVNMEQWRKWAQTETPETMIGHLKSAHALNDPVIVRAVLFAMPYDRRERFEELLVETDVLVVDEDKAKRGRWIRAAIDRLKARRKIYIATEIARELEKMYGEGVPVEKLTFAEVQDLAEANGIELPTKHIDREKRIAEIKEITQTFFTAHNEKPTRQEILDILNSRMEEYDLWTYDAFCKWLEEVKAESGITIESLGIRDG